MYPRIRVLLAEDDRLAQHAVTTYVNRADDLELVAVASDGQEALELARHHRPDVAIVDIHMPLLDGIGLTRALSTPALDCRVVCFTALGDDQTMLEALDAGASGFLLKSDNPALILHGVRSAYSGDSLVSPKLVSGLLRTRRNRSAPPSNLSGPERELLTLVGQGLSNEEIGERLHLAHSTIKTYVSRLLAKYKRPNRTALAALAHEWGLVQD